MELSDEFEDRLNAYFVGGITIFVPSFLLYMIFSIQNYFDQLTCIAWFFLEFLS